MGLEQGLKFQCCGAVGGARASPGEEAAGWGWGGSAGAENTVDEIGGEGREAEAVEGALEVVVRADDVGDEVDGGEVVIGGSGWPRARERWVGRECCERADEWSEVYARSGESCERAQHVRWNAAQRRRVYYIWVWRF